MVVGGGGGHNNMVISMGMCLFDPKNRGHISEINLLSIIYKANYGHKSTVRFYAQIH